MTLFVGPVRILFEKNSSCFNVKLKENLLNFAETYNIRKVFICMSFSLDCKQYINLAAL